jgi:hypothetical protein
MLSEQFQNLKRQKKNQQKTVERVKMTARFPRLVQGRVAELSY